MQSIDVCACCLRGVFNSSPFVMFMGDYAMRILKPIRGMVLGAAVGLMLMCHQVYAAIACEDCGSLFICQEMTPLSYNHQWTKLYGTAIMQTFFDATDIVAVICAPYTVENVKIRDVFTVVLIPWVSHKTVRCDQTTWV